MNCLLKIFSIILFVGFIQCRTPPPEEPLPNVIFIVADDLGYGDLSCYGQARFQTPNIDALARGGLVFTQHYSGSTVCAPSRSALLTGFHSGHTAIRGNKEVRPEGQYPLPDSVVTLAELFRSKGYVTGIFGKWGLGYPGSPGDPLNQGFETFMGFNCQRLAHNYYPTSLWHDRERVMIPENEGSNNGVYAPQLIQKHALDFLVANSSKPFFLYLPSILPHAELAAPPDYMERQRGKFEEVKSYKGSGPSDQHYKTGGYGSQSEPRTAFAAMITVLDDQVGEIISKLKELKLYENTIIIITSDNGPHKEGGADPDYFDSNGILRGYKRDLYEGGIRVPLIVHWPAKILPGKTDHVSAFWDFVPTFSELIGASHRTTDGISFAPTLLGRPDQQQSHEFLYWEFHEEGGKQALRMGNWKAVQLNVNEPSNSSLELYDLRDDPSEQHNLASDHLDVVAQMKELMQKAHRPSPVFVFGAEKQTP